MFFDKLNFLKSWNSFLDKACSVDFIPTEGGVTNYEESSRVKAPTGEIFQVKDGLWSKED